MKKKCLIISVLLIFVLCFSVDKKLLAQTTKVYNFAGITASNTDYNAYACDVDEFPFAGITGNRNSMVEATNAQYVNISADNSAEWATVDPGSSDEIFVWVEMKITETPSTITQIDFTFNGNTSNYASTHKLYVMTAGSTWSTSASWVQVGTSISIAAGIDTKLTGSITSNISNYIDANGKITWGVFESVSSEIERINYLEAKVYSGSSGSPTNIALTATGSTSFVSSWEALGAVNDNSNPSNSNDKTSGAYGNWDNPNTTQWVEYDWTSNYNITQTQVYWFDDAGGVLVPTTAYAEYWNGSAWVNCGTIPKVKDTWNTLAISNVTTNKFRISMLNTSQSTGILEWRVFGTPAGGGSDTQIPTTPGTPTSTNITSSGCTLNWTASTDNVAVTGYQILRNGSAYQTSTTNSATITGLTASTTYSFTVKAYDAAGNYSSASNAVSITTSAPSVSFSWPAYSPTISYNFVNEYGNVPTPTNVLNDCSGVVGTQSSDWWCFRWGATKNPLVTTAAITPMLSRLNTDFAYFRNIMGWPPDSRAINGYRSAVYLYGSGLCTDAASNTELGGWQSAVYYNNQNWPIILASYYPVYSFDPACTYSDKASQQSAMVHEGIHSVLASMPGCRDAAWFHEGGNTWLQQEAESRRTNSYTSMGFLNAAAMIAPFMPIECYSGWLQDGSFGGPSAEGVNLFNGSQQICTWKNLLGGTQYGNLFPTFLGQALGDGAVPWIWKYSTSRVLEGIASGLGETQIRRLICEYRAKQAVVDFGSWTDAIIALLDANMGVTIQEEWSPYNINSEPWIATPYAVTTNNNGTLTPASWTTPGWSGANQIPLTVSGTSVTVNFQPIGANMTCQLCYIATDGSRVYSNIVSSGNCSLTLAKAPANNVVIAVICNTDYVYNGESTRTAHFDYRLQLVSGIAAAASVNSTWYKGTSLKSASISPLPTFDISKYCSHGYSASKPIVSDNNTTDRHDAPVIDNNRMFPNPVAENGILNLEINNLNNEPCTLQICNMQGEILYSKITSSGGLAINTSGVLKQGMYVVTVKKRASTNTYKLVIN